MCERWFTELRRKELPSKKTLLFSSRCTSELWWFLFSVLRRRQRYFFIGSITRRIHPRYYENAKTVTIFSEYS